MTQQPDGAAVATSVQICVITFGRPEGLERLLRAVASMQRPEHCDLGIVVVDNDPAGTARTTVDVVRNEIDLDIVYDIQPERGIPFARNRALERALELEPEWIVWLDDDEAPHEDWLVRILDTQRAHDADVVLGPNDPVFEEGSTEWITRSGLLHYERFETGERYPFFHTRTSGVIMRSSVVPAERFDERMALSGGSDRLFFTHIHRNGGVFVYDNDAVVTEFVPASRARVRWLLKRWYRTGVTRSLTLLYVDDPAWPRRIRRVLGGLLMAAKGVGKTLVALPKGRVAVLRASRFILLGLGASSGALGVQYREYRTIHGR